MKGGNVDTVDIMSIAHRQRTVPADDPLVRAAREVGTSFGD
jgi:hypothetical protein